MRSEVEDLQVQRPDSSGASMAVGSLLGAWRFLGTALIATMVLVFLWPVFVYIFLAASRGRQQVEVSGWLIFPLLVLPWLACTAGLIVAAAVLQIQFGLSTTTCGIISLGMGFVCAISASLVSLYGENLYSQPTAPSTSSRHVSDVHQAHRSWAFRISLAGWFWLLLSLFFLTVAWLRSMNLLMLLAYQMLLLWGLNLILAGRRLHRLEARRRLDGPVFAGIGFRQEIEITNRDINQQLGLQVSERGPAHEQAGFVARLGPGERFAFTSELVLPRRGRYQGEPLRVESGYPFGLLKRWAVFGNRLDVIVLPRLGQVHRGRLRRFLQQASPAAGGLRSRARPQPLLATEFHGLRPFHSGDSLSWIHWRTSARRGELMVREFEEATSDNLVLAVDPWLPEGRPDPQAELLLEEAISLAATICWEWCRQTDDRLTLLLAGSSPVILHGSTGREHGQRLLECLALEPGTARPAWDTLLDRLPPGTLPAGPVLLVSTRSDDPGDDLAGVVRRPIARLNIAEVGRHDFYERPGHAS